MAFDPSVIGDIGPSAVPDLVGARGKALTLKGMEDESQIRGMQLKEATQEMSDKDAIRKSLQGVDVSNVSEVTKAAGKLGGPAGMKLMGEASQMALASKQQQELDLKIKEHLVKIPAEEFAAHQDRITNFMGPMGGVYDEYSRLIESGVPEGKARQQVQPMYQQAVLTMQQSGAFNKPEDAQQFQKLGPQFNPQIVRPMLQQTEQMAKHMADAAKERSTEKHQRTMEGIALKNAGGGTDSSEDELVRAIGEYRSPPPSAGNRSKAAQRLLEKVQKAYPNYDYTNWQQKSKVVQAFSSGKQGDAVRSLNVAVQHLDVLEDAFKALDNGDVKAFNKARALYLEQTGDNLPTNVEAAADFVGNEVSKAAMGAGVSGALADRENIKKQLTVAASQKQSGGQISTFKKLLAGQLKGLKKQYEASTGLGDFEDKLDPQTRSALESSTNDKPSNKEDPLGIRPP